MRPLRWGPIVLLVLTIGAGCTPSKPRQQVSMPPATPVAASPAPAASGQVLSVGVPCSLAMVYKEMRDLFLKRNPSVRFTQKIEDIKPLRDGALDGSLGLDVIINFGMTELEPLKQAGKLTGEPVEFMDRDMDLCVTKGNPLGLKSFTDVARPELRKVVLCDEDLTVGRAAERALKSAGIWEKVNRAGKLIRVDQPLKAKGLVISGKADAAFIYAAAEVCSVEHPERCVGDKADIIRVPKSAFGGMTGVAAVLTTAHDPKLAREFAEFAASPEVQAALAGMGYRPIR